MNGNIPFRCCVFEESALRSQVNKLHDNNSCCGRLTITRAGKNPLHKRNDQPYRKHIISLLLADPPPVWFLAIPRKFLVRFVHTDRNKHIRFKLFSDLVGRSFDEIVDIIVSCSNMSGCCHGQLK